MNPVNDPMATCRGVWAFKYNLDDITVPAATMHVIIGINKGVSARTSMAANKNPTRLPAATLCTLIFQKTVIRETIKLVNDTVSIATIKKLPQPN